MFAVPRSVCLTSVFTLVVSVGFARAQQPAAAAWRQVVLPGAPVTVVLVLWQHGFDADPADECGLARVVAECRLERARQAVAQVSDAGAMVFGDATLTFGVVPAGGRAAAQFARALLHDEPQLSDDTMALILARVALAADDAEWLYPGNVIESTLRAHMFVGHAAARPAAGRATSLQACTVALVRKRLQQPVTASGFTFGAAVEVALPGLPEVAPATRAASSLPASQAPGAPMTLRHARIDGAFVAVGFAVPAEVEPTVWVVAMEVARARAARSLRLRGEEMGARSPLLGWSWREAQPLVVFQRRGMDEGTAEHAVAELQALLHDLRQRPPSLAELDAAMALLAAETAMPPWSAELETVLARTPGALTGRAIAAVLAEHRGLHALAQPSLAGAAVHRALALGLAAERGHWLTLEPMFVDGRASR